MIARRSTPSAGGQPGDQRSIDCRRRAHRSHHRRQLRYHQPVHRTGGRSLHRASCRRYPRRALATASPPSSTGSGATALHAHAHRAASLCAVVPFPVTGGSGRRQPKAASTSTFRKPASTKISCRAGSTNSSLRCPRRDRYDQSAMPNWRHGPEPGANHVGEAADRHRQRPPRRDRPAVDLQPCGGTPRRQHSRSRCRRQSPRSRRRAPSTGAFALPSPKLRQADRRRQQDFGATPRQRPLFVQDFEGLPMTAAMLPLVTTEYGPAAELGTADLVTLDGSWHMPADQRDAAADFTRRSHCRRPVVRHR